MNPTHKLIRSFIINNLLLVFGLVMIFSGLTMQVGFHMSEHPGHEGNMNNSKSASLQYEEIRQFDPLKQVCGMNYHSWSVTHKIAIVFFTIVSLYHIYTHWKWYKGVISKRLIGKNFQVITFSVLFILVAITGIIPWIFDLSGFDSLVRLLFIEIHDKLTLIFIIFIILHIANRLKWYVYTYNKLKVPGNS